MNERLKTQYPGTFHPCISCMHCHLFHREKNDNRYYCQPPGKPALFLSKPHVKRTEPCHDFVQFRRAMSPVVSRLCDRLLESLVRRETGAGKSERSLTDVLSHDLHTQLDHILADIVEWEQNLTKAETELSIKFYFELAGHAVMRIAHLEGT